MKVKKMTIWLIVTYIIMVLLALYLNSKQTLSGILINVGFFVIVAFIFGGVISSLRKLNALAKQLRMASKTIENDYLIYNTYLWNKYSEENDNYLFVNEKSILFSAFVNYKKEMKHIEIESNGVGKCDIDSYINRELVDSYVYKSLLNIVPGVMTGLGILGTFIGLSFGLNRFNTGSAEEISDSIPPLMNGIKVAFHTSIYGMIFSLMYNWVYKTVLNDTYKALDEFIEKYYSYVCPDSFNENVSAIQSLIKEIPEAVGKSVETSISSSLTPALESMTALMKDFSESVTNNQLDGLKVIIDSFVNNMNQALGNQFIELGKVIEETSRLQKDNNEFIKEIANKIEQVTQNVIEIDDKSQNIVESLSSYISEIQNLQDSITEGYVNISAQIEEQKVYNENMNGYIEKLVSYEDKMGDVTNQYIEKINKQLEDTVNTNNNSIELLSKTIEVKNKLMVEESNAYIASLDKRFEMIQEMSRNITEEAQTSLEMISQSAEEQNDRLVDAYQKQIDAIEDTSRAILEETKTGLETISQSAEEQNNRLADTCQKQIATIIDISSSTTRDMENAAKELSKVSEELDKKLDNKLTYTFGKIDQSLADIAGHLSGTIVQINDTLDQVNDAMNRLPMVANAANESFRGSLNEMQDNVGSMKEAAEAILQSLEYLQETISESSQK